MTVRTRAKFICSGKQDNVGGGATIFLNTVYSEEIQSEDGRFTKATPWGELRMNVDNPDAAVQFEPGKSYYVDFTPAPN